MGASANTLKAHESAQTIARQGFKVRDLYYAYYGTLAAYQHQGQVWRDWVKKMQPEFLKTQAADGSWSFGDSHSGAMGRV
nr:hypothetical protein [Akkermansiaceae bacterium]